LIAARLKLPFDEAVVIAELLQDECRAYLDRQAAGLEDGEALLPEAAISRLGLIWKGRNSVKLGRWLLLLRRRWAKSPMEWRPAGTGQCGIWD
jgi:hypothetical protein